MHTRASGARDGKRGEGRARICCNLAIAERRVRRDNRHEARCAAADASTIDAPWFTPPTCAPRTLSVGLLHTATL
ncbi:hypothetical protein D1006_22920 [Burkholderia stabilis]|uniref:Uncharacterized protein n=1 Tax=Burkholderia stabilis TaxID=95485 RepID=A0A4Q2AE84_9BURK|nr:hypothetical protein D1006_22920 [Burkholderia stabilis]